MPSAQRRVELHRWCTRTRLLHQVRVDPAHDPAVEKHLSSAWMSGCPEESNSEELCCGFIGASGQNMSDLVCLHCQELVVVLALTSIHHHEGVWHVVAEYCKTQTGLLQLSCDPLGHDVSIHHKAENVLVKT